MWLLKKSLRRSIGLEEWSLLGVVVVVVVYRYALLGKRIASSCARRPLTTGTHVL